MKKMNKIETAKIKRPLMAIFVLCICFLTGSMLLPSMAIAATNGHTQAEAVAWANGKKGAGIDADGRNGVQCVD